MNLKKVAIILELSLIIIYILITFLSIVLQPINLILGIVCVLFLPGFNLLDLIKPQVNLVEKLGYSTILSVAIENILMILIYLSVYNLVSNPANGLPFTGLIYNPTLLIIAIQIISLALILLKKLKKKENNNKFKTYFEEIKLKSKKQIIKLVIFIIFSASLILLCFSTLNSNAPTVIEHYISTPYRLNFTFYNQVPFMFYIFLAISILSLIYIIFNYKNKYYILISISVFIFCLWILPYLQIKNYFSRDTFYLYQMFQQYSINGISNVELHGFCILPEIGSLRYSTSLFTVIILKSATGAEINYVLWYLYPLIYALIPFFFYSIFQKYHNTNEKSNNHLYLTILTIFIIFLPQFIKSGHNTSTGVIGIIIYIMLIVEFYDSVKDNNLNTKDFFFIIILYFFLCFTHFEECIYFIFLILFYSPIYIILRIEEIKNNNYSKDNIESIKRIDAINNLKTSFFKISFLLCFLILIFYLTTEFFGYTTHYIEKFVGKGNPLSNFLLISFYNIKIVFVGIIVLGNIFYYGLCSLCFIKYYDSTVKIYNLGIKILEKIIEFIKKLFSIKTFQILFFPISIIIVILIDLFLFTVYRENYFYSVIALIIIYLIPIFYIFLFFKGLKYYKIESDKFRYFFLFIIASSLGIGLTFVLGFTWYSVYIFHTKFLFFFTFFFLIIIQNSYFYDIMRKRKYFIICLITLVITLGTISSLIKLAYG